MSSQFFGRFSLLNPTIAFGGFTAGAVVQFNSEPFAGQSPDVVSGTLQAVTGTTSKTLTFAREFQLFSYTDSFGDEIEYKALMGGNIVQTGEPERGYSHRNPRAFRGGDARDRCEPGDVVWHNGRAFLITEAWPFDGAPASVSWQGDEPLATVWTLDANINDLSLPRDTYGANTGAFEHWDDSTDVFGGNTLEIDDSGWEACERVIFNRPSDSAPDVFLYPPNAQFSTSPTAAEFWWDSWGRRFRLASHNESRGDTYRASYWVRSLEEWAATGTTEVWGLANTDNADGFADTVAENEDRFAMLATRIGGTFNRVFRVYKRGGAFPDLAFMWRTDAAVDSAMVGVEMSGGTPAFRLARATAGSGTRNAITPSPGYPPVATGNYYDIRATLTGSTMEFTLQDEGGSEELIYGTSITGAIPASPSGWVGFAVWGNAGVRFSGFEAGEDVALVRVEAQGEMGVRVEEFSPARFQNVAYSITRAKKTAEMLQGLRNVTASIDMTESATKRRDTYDLSGSDITVWSESSGDLIQVTEAAPSSAPGGTGRIPQVTNTVDFATQDSSDANENRAHWRDRVIIHDPDEEFEGTGGQTVEIKRNAVFDSRNPPTLSWSHRDATGDEWNAMTPGTDYIGRWAAGLVFLSAAFVAAREGEGVEDKLCFRSEGVRILHNGSQTARQFNDMAGALDEFDELWCAIGGIGGEGIECHGGGSIEGGFGDYTCNVGLECWVPTSFAWGATPNQMNAGAPFPQWVSGSKRFSSMSYDPSPGTVSCGADNLNLAGVHVDGLFQYTINPNTVNPFVSEAVRFGASVLPPSIATEVTFGFSFAAPALTMNQVIAGLPDGSVCVEAYTRARFTGLNATTITVEYETRGIISESTISNINTDTDLDEAPITAAILLARRDSVQVFDGNGDPLTIADWEFKFAGSGTPITIPAGEWRRIEITDAINGVIANRDSRYNRILILPTMANAAASANGMEGYLLSLIPEYTGEITDTEDCAVDYRWTATATEVSADSMEFDAILARFRLPDGSLTPVLPIVGTAFME